MSAVIVLPLLALLGRRRRRRSDDHLDSNSPEVLEAGGSEAQAGEDEDLEADERLERSAREQHELVEFARNDLASRKATRKKAGQDEVLVVPSLVVSQEESSSQSILSDPLVESPQKSDKTLPCDLPTKRSANPSRMPNRSVTIDEAPSKRHHPIGLPFPTLRLQSGTEEKTTLRPSLPRRIASGLSSFVEDIAQDWEHRHDPEHVGFWSRTWDVISLERWARKERERLAADTQRNGNPDWIPPKYRWTPILSGVIVPFSILLEVPGLTEHWYVKTIDNVPVVYQSNPALLDVALGISLACAVVSSRVGAVSSCWASWLT